MNNNSANTANNQLTPPSSAASSPGVTDAGKQRYVTILVGASRPGEAPRPGSAPEIVVHAMANTVASDRREAMSLAHEHLLSEGLVPITAWSISGLKALVRDLEECALDPDTPVRLNQVEPRPEDASIFEEVQH